MEQIASEPQQEDVDLLIGALEQGLHEPQDELAQQAESPRYSATTSEDSGSRN